MNYIWDFSAVFSHADLLILGLRNTVLLAIVSIAIGLAVGLALAALLLCQYRVPRYAALAFVEFYRSTPPIVHFFWFYFALPVLFNIEMSPFAAAVLALSTQSSAFYAEVFRGGILSIERGQREAGSALGMTKAQAMRRVVLPQAVARMIAPLVERSFELTKTTALASTLAFADLLYQAMMINSETFRPLEVYTLVALMYLILLTFASALARIGERRAARWR
ncbi:amino acid ABC transporter permease [Pararhizobium sp. YC-54]|uniref:amino acid ABC transporter permease n=1 Tax=Pararhizobium sp. YC-54 TaxID=2986920 RepID=UPI0021F6EA00|nr:amino acid ABC transporter permease [Pararhizobium sp. YC-54]MCW0001487.1 amino acid ABC transporter permease [Pararhizobium sp. YC-54]